MNSGSTPPGGEGRDPPRPRMSFASSLFSRRAARSEPSAPSPDARRAEPPSLFPSMASQPAGPSGPQPVEPSSDRDRTDAAATRHRVAGGLPHKPAPLAAADGPVRPKSGPTGAQAGSTKGTVSATPPPGPAVGNVKSAAAASSATATSGAAKPDSATPPRLASGKVGALSPSSGRSVPSSGAPPPRPQPGWCLTRESPSRRYPVGPSMDLAPR